MTETENNRDITASDLEDIVLREMRSLASTSPQGEVPLKSLAEAVASETALKHFEASEVRRLVNEATRNLKRQGLIHFPRRGHRSLTDEGREDETPQPTHDERTAMTSSASDVSYVPATFALPEGEKERNLIRLKSESAPCFGYHRDVSACRGCSIREACHAKQAEVLGEIAARLDKEDRMNAEFERLRGAIETEGEERNQAILDLIELVNDNKNPLDAKEIILCPTYTFCWVCDEVIAPGEKSQWRPNQGASHLTCNP